MDGAGGHGPGPVHDTVEARWLRENEPQAAAGVERIMPPHDQLTLQLCGEFTTDRSDASGAGYYDAAQGRHRPELLVRSTSGRSLSCRATPR